MQRHGFLVDMDGVIYRGNELIPGGREFIEYLKSNKLPFLFLTNNSRPTKLDIVRKLKRFGIVVDESNVYTSAIATAKFLSSQHPHATAFVIGEGGLLNALHDFEIAVDETRPDYVVIGEGRTWTAENIEKAIDFVIGGAKLIGTNLDPAPKIKGWMKPGTGAIIKMIEEATGKRAFSVGKPSPIMMRNARKQLNLQAAETTMIGDTMATDILGGVLGGIRTILTLTGDTKKEDLAHYAYQPNFVVDSVKDVIPLLGKLLQDQTDRRGPVGAMPEPGKASSYGSMSAHMHRSGIHHKGKDGQKLSAGWGASDRRVGDRRLDGGRDLRRPSGSQ
jgi:NagD protein